MSREFIRIACCAALVAGLSGCRDDGPVVPAAAIKNVMATATEPASKRIFEAAAEPPATESAWLPVEADAREVADSARRLAVAVRGGQKHEWVGLANAMATAAGQVGVAAAAHDADALAKAGDALYETCDACHRAFQPKMSDSSKANPAN